MQSLHSLIIIICLLWIVFTGVIVGVILRYVFPNGSSKQFFLASDGDQCNESMITQQFQVGDNLRLSTNGGDEFICSISGKVFRSTNGDTIENAASLLIIFYLHLIYYSIFA